MNIIALENYKSTVMQSEGLDSVKGQVLPFITKDGLYFSFK